MEGRGWAFSASRAKLGHGPHAWPGSPWPGGGLASARRVSAGPPGSQGGGAQCPCGACRAVWPPGGGPGRPGQGSDQAVLQDRKIAHCPFHTLTPAERETFLARKRLLDYMGVQLRRAVLARESQWDPKLLCLSKRGGGHGGPWAGRGGPGAGLWAGRRVRWGGAVGEGRGGGRGHPGPPSSRELGLSGPKANVYRVCLGGLGSVGCEGLAWKGH